MNKLEVILKVANTTGVNKEDTQMIIEMFLKVIQQGLLENKNIHIKGFGKFLNKKRAKKVGRNLTDNTAIIIDAHYVPTLKVSKDFVERIKKTIKD